MGRSKRSTRRRKILNNRQELRVKERAYANRTSLTFLSKVMLLVIILTLLMSLFESTARASTKSMKVYEIKGQARFIYKTPRGLIVFQGDQTFCTFNQMSNELKCKLLVIESQLTPINNVGI